MYQILYAPGFNKFYRNLIKTVAPNWKWKSKIPVSGIVKLGTEKGTLLVETNPTSFATKHIFWSGMDQFEYIPIFKKMIPKFNSFVDIGANTGIYSTLGCLFNPELKVLSFEPSVGPFEYLKRNIKNNHFENRITPYQLAASSEKGEAEFYEVSNLKYTYLKFNLGGVGNLAKKIAHRSMETNLVPTEMLDNLLAEKHPKFVPDLIKIDTEATEDIVLRGMPKVITDHRPIFICETLYHRIEDNIEAIFAPHDYLFFNHVKDKNTLIQVNTLARETDNGVRDCFIVPKEKVALIQEFVS